MIPRSFDIAGQFVRFVSPDPHFGGERVLVGLAVPFFETVSAPQRGGLDRRFMPGAFCKAIRTSNVCLLLNHARESPLIASTQDDGALCLWEAEAGLMFRFTPESAIGHQVLSLAAKGSYIGASAGYRPFTSTATESAGVSCFTECDLVEISLVPRHERPAFASTWVSVTTLAESISLERTAEAHILMISDRPLSYGGRDRFLHKDVSYSVPVLLARSLIAQGFARAM